MMKNIEQESNLIIFKDFFFHAYKFVFENFREDLKWIENLTPEDIDEEKFLSEYIWVVLCSGFKVSLARKIYEKLMDGFNLDAVKHPSKKKAISTASRKYQTWFNDIKNLKSDEEKLEYLETLPHIGKITKYHLAKNIGIKVSKPDVHLTRLAQKYGFKDSHEMCKALAKKVNISVNVIDQVLWRYCEQNSDYLQE